MALFNEILVGRYNSILHKLLGIKATEPAPQCSSDLDPGITLENDRPEWAFLSGEKLLQGNCQIAAAATFNSRFRFRVALNSGIICVIDRIEFNKPTGGAVEAYIHPNLSLNADLPTTANMNSCYRDTRWSPVNQNARSAPRLSGTNADTATQGSVFWQETVPANTPITIIGPWVLYENASIDVRNTTVNEAFSCNWWWRERPVEQSEIR